MQVHRTTKAVLVLTTIGTNATFHPVPVAKLLKLVVPNIKKIIGVDVSLRKTPIDVGTSGNRTVGKHRAYVYAGTTEVMPVANLAVVVAKISFATELSINPPLLARGNYKVHKLLQLRAI